MELDESFALLPDGSKHADSEGLQDGSGESSGAGASELYSRRPRSLPAPLFEDGMHGPLLDQQGSVYSSRAPPSYLLQSERQIAGMPYTAPFPGRSATPSQFPADYLGRAGAGLPQVRQACQWSLFQLSEATAWTCRQSRLVLLTIPCLCIDLADVLVCAAVSRCKALVS